MKWNVFRGKKMPFLGKDGRWHKYKIKYVGDLEEKECGFCHKTFKPKHPSERYCCEKCRFLKGREFKAEHQKRMREAAKKAREEEIENEAKVEATTNNERKENDMEVKTITRPDGTTWTPPVKTCPTCGKKFVCATNRQVFCSDECRDKAYALKKNGVELPRRTKGGYVSTAPTEPRKCDICGKEFMPRTKKCRYCSKECGQEAMRRCTRKWHEVHEGRYKEYVARRNAVKRGEVVADKCSEAAAVIRRLIEAGVDNDVVAKYLQTVFGGK